jgi:hypothetical protein
MASNYEIQAGDSYWDIAKALYGGDDAAINENRKILQALNEGKALFAGDTLMTGMPEPEPQRASMPDPRGGGLQGGPVSYSMTEPRGQFGGPTPPPAPGPQPAPGGFNIMNLPPEMTPDMQPNMRSAPTSFSSPNTMGQTAPPQASSMPDPRGQFGGPQTMRDPFQYPMKMASGAPDMGMLAALIERARGR